LPPRHAPSSTTRKTSAVHALEGEVTLPRVVVGTRFFRGCQSNVRGAPRSLGPARFTSHQSGSLEREAHMRNRYEGHHEIILAVDRTHKYSWCN
jgi:hypothetical protein